MGVYDSVMVPCPRCGREVSFQSKSGPCELRDYKLDECPLDVLVDVNRHSPHACEDDDCPTAFEIHFRTSPNGQTVSPYVTIVDGPAWPDNEGARHYIPLPSVDGDAA